MLITKPQRYAMKHPTLRGLIGAVGVVAASGFAQATSVTKVEFAVSDSGAATLSIPIQIPRGIGGMEPQLTLSYSSGAGNGMLGQGWTLMGPSAITRCPMTRLHDQEARNSGVRGTVTFTASDRFCLDGQRLILVDPNQPNAPVGPSASGYGAPGAEYRTERDGFSRIRAVGTYSAGTPRGFTVETKSGLIMEFGVTEGTGTHNSQILTHPVAAGVVPTINRWMLRRIRDRLGSSVEFEYCTANVLPAVSAPVPHTQGASSCSGTQPGVSLLHFIRYTNRPGQPGTFGVMFRYENRPDVVSSFYRGTMVQLAQRMSAIQTYVGFPAPGAPGSAIAPGTHVRTYDIHYEPIESGTTGVRATNASRIQRIQEKGADGLTTLPPVTFTMAQDSVLGMNVSHRPAALPGTPGNPGCGGSVGQIRQICP